MDVKGERENLQHPNKTTNTGEIRLTGWREQSSKISKLNVGDRIKILDAVAGMGGKENKLEITLKGFTEIRNME